MESVVKQKFFLSSALAGIMYFIGWQGLLFILLVVALVIDYLSGSLAARKHNEWNSRKATEGRVKKALVFVALITAIILDTMIMILVKYSNAFNLSFDWPFAFTLVSTVWFILSEAGSTLENLAIYGLNIPKFLIKGIKVLKGKVENVGDHLIEEESEV